MTNNIFLIESPLQALIASEVTLKQEGVENVAIIKLNNSPNSINNKQIEMIVSLGRWKKTVRLHQNKSLSQKLVFHLRLSMLSQRYRLKTSVLYIGDFRSPWMHFFRISISAVKNVLIDDGASTIAVYYDYLSKNILSPYPLQKVHSIKAQVKSLFIKLLYGDLQTDYSLELLTLFNLSPLANVNITKLQINQITNLLSITPPFSEKCTVFFGSKYSEKEIISIETELELISHANKTCRLNKKNLVYLPHREESQSKLDLIKKNLDIKVLRLELPAEIYFLKFPYLFESVWGIYSSTLYTSKQIIPNTEVFALKINSSKINKCYLTAIQNVYSFYQKEGIQIISFPEML